MADDEATGWFEPLYAEAAAGRGRVPWDGAAATPLLHAVLPDGTGRAIVIGCGLGDDAVQVAACGWDTLAFDVAPTALRMAAERFPDAPVEWAVGDLLELPDDWLGTGDLVLEHYTVQAMPPRVRAAATAAVRSLVAPAGTLVVLATSVSAVDDDHEGPPWPLTEAEARALGADWTTSRFELVHEDSQWLATFVRPT